MQEQDHDLAESPKVASPEKQPTTVMHAISEISKTVLLAVLVIVGARTLVLPYQVEGASMTPNLHDHERVLVNRMVYFNFDLNEVIDWIPGIDVEGVHVVYPFHAPERGDIVVLYPPTQSDQPYIKRVIGLPGESVTFDNGYVFIDGERLKEPYIEGPITRCGKSRNCDLGVIPDGYVFVLGDNRENSSDSRVFGLVKVTDIIGKAWFTNWPLSDLGLVPHYDYAEE